ncbi:hypothetical protein JHK84_050996 [Glycine max]|nr:hypothetical protein JHK84_050996 [Glycine max]
MGILPQFKIKKASHNNERLNHPLLELAAPKIVEHHFHDLMQRYGEIVAIDLDKHGEEGQLSAAYAAEMQNQQHLSRYFLIDRQGNILEEQRGLVRLNYIDSLDRTNVTQRYLAQKSLNIQLQRIEVLTSSECISMFA